ncbi:hypothetical protein BGZ82_003230 [Podila clonocystis]|nr:hypothetical protein BGZ82_003230 [Podila clonocystis]
MSTSISIFDIHLIIDSICGGLDLHDIHICRQVNKQWGSLFKPYLWNAIKLTSSDTYEHIDTISNNMHRIRSLTVASEHIDEISYLGLTTLQELILYDEIFEPTCDDYEDNSPVNIGSILALIDNNRNMRSLTIDLNACHYHSRQLSPSLMLAIGRHPSLTRLTWRIPGGHGNEEFAERLLRVCHKSIQELFVYYKCISRPYFDLDHVERLICGHPSWTYFCFSEFNGQDVPPIYKELQRRWPLEVPLDHMEPFLLRKIYLPYWFNFCIPALLRNCPELEDAGYLFTESVDVLTRLPAVQRVGLFVTWDRASHAADLIRIRYLQRIRLLDLDHQILSLLAASSLHSLEELSLHSFPSPKVIVACLVTFPNLKEINVVSVKIRVWDAKDSSHRPPRVQSTIEDLDSLDTVVQDWEPSQNDYVWVGSICNWWKEWTGALHFMQAVLKTYQRDSQQSELRPIHMQFMYPIKTFLPRDVAQAYVNISGPWSRTRSILTMSDVRCMVTEREMLMYRYAWHFEDSSDDLFYYYYEFIQDWQPELDLAISKSRHRHRSLWGVQKQRRQRRLKK